MVIEMDQRGQDLVMSGMGIWGFTMRRYLLYMFGIFCTKMF